MGERKNRFVMEVQTCLIDLVKYAREMKLTKKDLVVLVKRQLFIDVLTDNNCNQCRAAVELGMHRNTLARELDALGINVRNLKKKPAARAMIAAVRENRIAN